MTSSHAQSILTTEAAYSTLQPSDLLAKVVPQYELPTITACEFWQQGQNDTYKLFSGKENYILRVYRQGWRTRSAIEFELEALLYLQSRGARIACPIARRDGGFISSVMAPEGERYVIVTEYAWGEILRFEEAADATLFGQAVAEIHNCSSGFQPRLMRQPLDLGHLIYQPLVNIQPYLSHRPKDWEFLIQFADGLAEKISGVASDLDYGFCHGDFHGENAHVYRGVVTHFDFDCCGLGWRSYDLATFKWVMTLLGKAHKLWPLFLESYQSITEISDLDISLVETFMAVRDIWFFGLSTANSLARGWLDDSYIDIHINFLKCISEEI
ncbi:MAG: phosphotransferase [Cyanobacteria bacterium P01_D01_bin.56]